MSSAPAGVVVDYHKVVYGLVDTASSMTLTAQLDTGDSVTLSSLTEDVYYMAMGFTTAVGGDIHGPGNVLMFSVPYNAFPNLDANNTAISRLVSGLSGKTTADDFVNYTSILRSRIVTLEEAKEQLELEVQNLLRQISAIRSNI